MENQALEMMFFVVHGYWPENVGDQLPPGTEFKLRGIRTVVTTQWEEEKKRT